MTYDIKIYKTEKDYEERNFTHCFQGFNSKEDAEYEGQFWTIDHDRVIILSIDDEEIINMISKE